MRFYILGFLLAFVPAILAEAPKKGDVSLQDLIKEGQEKFEKALSDIKKNAGLSENPTGDEIVKLVKEKNDKLAKDLQDFGKKIEEQIKASPEANEALKTVKTKLKEASDKLKKENPAIAKDAEKLGANLQSAWESVIQIIEKSTKEYKASGKQAEIEEFFKNIIDKGAAAARDLQANVEKVINKKN